MDALNNLMYGFGIALEPINIAYVFAGVFAGTIIGMLPGLGPISALALMIPITFAMEPSSGLIPRTPARLTLFKAGCRRVVFKLLESVPELSVSAPPSPAAPMTELTFADPYAATTPTMLITNLNLLEDLRIYQHI